MGFTLLKLSVFAFFMTACTTTSPMATYGVQPEHASFVPARIAIAPCQAWPAGARFASLPLSSASGQESQALCSSLDAYVLNGFSGQPYMKGYSPKNVAKALAEAGSGASFDKLPSLWAHAAGDCQACETPPAYYEASIAKRQPWQLWLADLAKAAHGADAVLLPFVSYAGQKNYSDRGLEVNERHAGVVLLLVDTNSGVLLWAGGREAAVASKRLTGGNVAEALTPPPWADVERRLFTDELWREFPGRETL